MWFQVDFTRKHLTLAWGNDDKEPEEHQEAPETKGGSIDFIHSATDVRTEPYNGVYEDDKSVDLGFGFNNAQPTTPNR